MKHPILLLSLLAIATLASAQNTPKYDFIRYDSNRLHYDTNSMQMRRLMQKWNRVAERGQGTLNIMHIGGSHVQAGTLSHRIRCNIFNTYPDRVGARGMIFPYSAAAKCNNPADYKIHCVEKVGLTRCVYKEPEHTLGLTGIAITAHDSTTTIQIILNEPRFDFATNRIVVLGESPDGIVPSLRFATDQRDSYQMLPGQQGFGIELKPSKIETSLHRYTFDLPITLDSFDIVLPCDSAQSFTLNGVMLANNRNGITLHSIGVNGASVPDYLKCPNFKQDLQLIKPDLVIFGIGINDAAAPDFDTVVFKENYLMLVDSIRAVSPQCDFIFITNNDSYKKVKKHYHVNTNGALARDVFYRLADETGGAVWDQFEVMGGLKSMEKWRVAKLAQYDRVHFTRAGYELVGDLFWQAFYNEFLQYKSKPIDPTKKQ